MWLPDSELAALHGFLELSGLHNLEYFKYVP